MTDVGADLYIADVCGEACSLHGASPQVSLRALSPWQPATGEADFGPLLFLFDHASRDASPGPLR
jgi:hypothetical protein